MTATGFDEILDIAMLPVADGRQLMVPLTALAEVQQVNFAGRLPGDLGELGWRGYQLTISSLDVLVGLPEPVPERLTTVGIFKADRESDPPFRALAFSGTASPGRIAPDSLEVLDTPLDGHFLAAVRMHEQAYLIPDLKKLLFQRPQKV
jgi:hypothetical protein